MKVEIVIRDFPDPHVPALLDLEEGEQVVGVELGHGPPLRVFVMRPAPDGSLHGWWGRRP